MNSLLNDIITVLGGFGVVLSGLFIYMGKIQLENHKSSLSKENQKLKALNDGAVHVSKSRFDKEFEIYQELWDSLVELKHATLSLRPMLDHVPQDKTKDELKTERLQKFGEANNEFVRRMQKYEPFYSSEVNESLNVICKASRSEAIGFQYQDSNDRKYWEEQEKNEKEIISEIQNCCSLIKQRIDSLSVIES
jgi:hypothetical protein